MSDRLPIVDFSTLLEPLKKLAITKDDIEKLAEKSDIEKFLCEKIDNAKKNLLDYKFNDFWEVFVFFFIGEIEIKIILEKYIELKKTGKENLSLDSSKQIMKLISFFINCRQKLVESLFEFIINYFKVNSSKKGNTDLFFEVQKFIIILVNVLKGSYKTKNRFHSMIIDDIEVSLNSALSIGNFHFNIK